MNPDEDVYLKARYLIEHFTRIPAYLADDEEWAGAVAMARDMLGIKERAPVCKHCGSIAPYGDERHIWISIHTTRWHRWWWSWKRRLEEGGE